MTEQVALNLRCADEARLRECSGVSATSPFQS